MTASDHLSTEQFGPLFHGTKAVLNVGDVVLPHKIMRERGITQEEGLQNTDRAWAARNAWDAHKWGSDSRHKGGLSRVYEVEPVGQVAEHGDLGVSSREGFRVRREVPFGEVLDSMGSRRK